MISLKQHQEMLTQAKSSSISRSLLNYLLLTKSNKCLSIRSSQSIFLEDNKLRAYTSLLLVRNLSQKGMSMTLTTSQLTSLFSLARNSLVELATGEGKSLLNLVTVLISTSKYEQLHLLTVNTYLSCRDFSYMSKVLNLVKISTSLVNESDTFISKIEKYKSRVIFSTISNVIFDYLLRPDLMRVTNSCAIIDEVDAAILDRAAMPYVISSQTQANYREYLHTYYIKSLQQLDKQGLSLLQGKHYVLGEDNSFLYLTDVGIKEIERKAFKEHNIFNFTSIHLLHILTQYLKASYLLQKRVAFLYSKGSLILLDKDTGRPLEDQSYSDLLQQAVEVSNGVTVSPFVKTLSSIKLRDFFLLYKNFLGYSGSLQECGPELYSTYEKDISSHQPSSDKTTLGLGSIDSQGSLSSMLRVCNLLKSLRNKGQPSILLLSSDSESMLSSTLIRATGTYQNLLGSFSLSQESFIVSRSNYLYSSTASNNMLGRGTDILASKLPILHGPYLINRSLSSNYRNLVQGLGRVGRQGLPGVVLSVLEKLSTVSVDLGTSSIDSSKKNSLLLARLQASNQLRRSKESGSLINTTYMRGLVKKLLNYSNSSQSSIRYSKWFTAVRSLEIPQVLQKKSIDTSKKYLYTFNNQDYKTYTKRMEVSKRVKSYTSRSVIGKSEFIIVGE